jgi:transcriptional regulator with XRE-family HTH domain
LNPQPAIIAAHSPGKNPSARNRRSRSEVHGKSGLLLIFARFGGHTRPLVVDDRHAKKISQLHRQACWQPRPHAPNDAGDEPDRARQRYRIDIQQVQKYEKGTNRIGAGRLHEISRILQVPISFFFEGSPRQPGAPHETEGTPVPTYVTDFLATSDGLALTKAFMQIKDANLRRRIVSLVQEITRGEDSGTSDN